MVGTRIKIIWEEQLVDPPNEFKKEGRLRFDPSTLGAMQNKSYDLSITPLRPTCDPKVYFTNQDNQNFFRVKHLSVVVQSTFCTQIFDSVQVAKISQLEQDWL